MKNIKKNIAILIVLFFSIPLFAAADDGRISGCVSDESGLALPGAVVEVHGLKSMAYTGPDGCYQIDSVPAGTYQVEFKLPGFESSTKEGVVVFPSRQAIVDRTLRISLKAEMVVTGRKPLRDLVEESNNLVGIADAASEGAVRSEQLELRAVSRPGEMLESVPGVVVSQHSGQGKANQYYLRGFNLDHGTDLAIMVDGIPANYRTHGHGQGYADLSFLIPELVNDVQFKKGPYYAEEGDFSAAGAIRLDYTSDISRPIAGMEGGSYEYGRALLLGSPKVGNGNFLYALELYHNNGPWEKGDDYRKINGVLKYTWEQDKERFSITAMGYDGKWNATDQVPQRAVDSGSIGRFGSVDSSDGGDSQRYSLAANWKHSWKDALTETSAYFVRYDLNLFSNFTYYLDDPVNGDQFQQADERTLYGLNLTHRWLGLWGGRENENEAGMEFRADDIGKVGLYHTRQRALLSTTSENSIYEQSWSGYWSNTLHWSDWFRTVAGIRVDYFRFDIGGPPKDSAIASPKFAAILGPWKKTEYYINFGYGFHSNDVRAAFDPEQDVSPLVRAKGYEAGWRASFFRSWQSTLTVWRLDFDSELVFAGDAGSTEAGRPSKRSGIEWIHFFRPASWVSLEANYAYSWARFKDDHPAGDKIPGAVEGIFTGGITIENLGMNLKPLKHTVGIIVPKNAPSGLGNTPLSRLICGLHVRYFGPRPLIEDNSVRSKPSTLVTLTLGYKISNHWNAFLDVFNLLDAKSSDIDYFYKSRLPGEISAGLDDVHTHPVEPLSIRLTITRSF